MVRHFPPSVVLRRRSNALDDTAGEVSTKYTRSSLRVTAIIRRETRLNQRKAEIIRRETGLGGAAWR